MKKLLLILIILICFLLNSGVYASYPGSIKSTNTNTPPTITLKGKNTVYISLGKKYKETGYIANDGSGGDLTKSVLIENQVNINRVGTYHIRYAVKDSMGNISDAIRTVKVMKLKKTPVSSKGLPILMYHFFYNKNKGEHPADNNWLEIHQFEKQMKYLSDHQYTFPSWNDIYDYINGNMLLPPKSIAVTVDDGNKSFFKLALPVLKKYNITATSFVITKRFKQKDYLKYNSPILHFQSHSNDMHRAGMDGKGRFLTMSYKDAYNDLAASRKVLPASDVFCYPFGHYNLFTIKVLKAAGFKLAVTTRYGKVYPGSNQFTLPRIRVFEGESFSCFIGNL